MDAVDEADALEKMRSEIAAQYEAGGEVQATAEESMKNLGLTSMEISRWGCIPEASETLVSCCCDFGRAHI